MQSFHLSRVIDNAAKTRAPGFIDVSFRCIITVAAATCMTKVLERRYGGL